MTVPRVNSPKETVSPFHLCDANVESPHQSMEEDFCVWPPALFSTTFHVWFRQSKLVAQSIYSSTVQLTKPETKSAPVPGTLTFAVCACEPHYRLMTLQLKAFTNPQRTQALQDQHLQTEIRGLPRLLSTQVRHSWPHTNTSAL